MMAPREGRILTGQFALATVVNLLVSLVFFMLMVVMAVYAVDRFGVSDPQAGLAASVFIIGALAVRPFVGRFLDVVGRRRVLVAGLVVFAVATVLYVPADRFELLLAVRLLHGAGLGAAHTAITASVMSVLPLARRSEGMGYFTMSGNVATAIGPLLAIGVVRAADHAALFRLAAVLAGVALALSLVLRLPAPPRDRMAPRALLALRLGDFVERGVVPVAAMMLLVGVAFSGVLTFIDGYATGNGLAGDVGGFFAVYSGVILVSRLFVGRIHDTRGDNIVVYPALVAVALGLLVLAWVPTTAGMLTSGALLGLGTGTLISSSHVIAVSISPAHRVGLATSTFFLMLDLGTGIGPVLLGVVIAQWDASTMYAGLAVVVLVAGVVYHLAHGRGVTAARRPADVDVVLPGPCHAASEGPRVGQEEAAMDPALAAALHRSQVIDMTTTGRRTGLPRRIEIFLHELDGRLFISGMPSTRTREWLRNVAADPHVTIHLKQHHRAELPASARVIEDPAERRPLIEAAARRWGRHDVEEMMALSPLIEVFVEDGS